MSVGQSFRLDDQWYLLDSKLDHKSMVQLSRAQLNELQQIIATTYTTKSMYHTSYKQGMGQYFVEEDEFRSWFGGATGAQWKDPTLLDKILRWYYAAMAGDIRSPLIHLVGPPGCGKSLSVEQAAEILDVNLHIINVSRISPLELEGVQMPDSNNTKLKMLTATWWKNLKDGDIVLLDEFLRGFPEVYNGLLDILTARRVGEFRLPKVFFIAASNSVATYDKALEDRLLHIMVDDPRKKKSSAKHAAKLLVEATGMMPDSVTSYQMDQLLEQEVFPMYAMLDAFVGKANVSAASIKGHSIRNLIGQCRLREFESSALKELIDANNREAMSKGAYQYVILLDGKNPDPVYEERARKLVGNPKLTEIQQQNLDLNLQLIEMWAALAENSETEQEDDDDDPFH